MQAMQPCAVSQKKRKNAASETADVSAAKRAQARSPKPERRGGWRGSTPPATGARSGVCTGALRLRGVAEASRRRSLLGGSTPSPSLLLRRQILLPEGATPPRHTPRTGCSPTKGRLKTAADADARSRCREAEASISAAATGAAAAAGCSALAGSSGGERSGCAAADPASEAFPCMRLNASSHCKCPSRRAGTAPLPGKAFGERTAVAAAEKSAGGRERGL
ncbi:uncharacterized protein LOC113146859 [Cyclospora cayetanensis]|uniref:Uncharacterized protein LOC113146859 n=1 Tax=Cyclospora cayetanensis TaxID=88456 RepID=A0A6P6RUW3_9EIME|nr:uncharacterized protein LOC113146859 [Cyclospora cayetanensis]